MSWINTSLLFLSSSSFTSDKRFFLVFSIHAYHRLLVPLVGSCSFNVVYPSWFSSIPDLFDFSRSRLFSLFIVRLFVLIYFKPVVISVWTSFLLCAWLGSEYFHCISYFPVVHQEWTFALSLVYFLCLLLAFL